MTPDYDLTNLQIDQADLWIYLQVDVILAQILADQTEHRASPLALGTAPNFAALTATAKPQAVLNST
jgi:hypothetical protein